MERLKSSSEKFVDVRLLVRDSTMRKMAEEYQNVYIIERAKRNKN